MNGKSTRYQMIPSSVTCSNMHLAEIPTQGQLAKKLRDQRGDKLKG